MSPTSMVLRGLKGRDGLFFWGKWLFVTTLGTPFFHNFALVQLLPLSQSSPKYNFLNFPTPK